MKSQCVAKAVRTSAETFTEKSLLQERCVIMKNILLILVLALQILRAEDVRNIPKGEFLIRKLRLK